MGPDLFLDRRVSPVVGSDNPSDEGLDRRPGTAWLTRLGASPIALPGERGSGIGALCDTA